MAERAGAESTVKKVLGCAASFVARHKNDKAVSRTFGYFTHHPVAPLNKKRLLLLLQFLEKRASDMKRPLRVLDLACGGGLITCAAAAMGNRSLGMDLSQDEIRLARLFAQEQMLDGMFMQADLLEQKDWENKAELALGGKPDVVTLAYALHHLERVEEFVDRLSRWLTPGAVLLINEENPESPLFRLKHRVRGWIQKDTETEWHRTHGGWKQLLEARGFQVQPQIFAADPLPGLAKFRPHQCWSLVFAAQRS